MVLVQLVFGRNPNFPCVLQDKLPGLEVRKTSKVVAQNLNAMDCARQALIASETSKKIQRTLRHNVRSLLMLFLLQGTLCIVKGRAMPNGRGQEG